MVDNEDDRLKCPKCPGQWSRWWGVRTDHQGWNGLGMVIGIIVITISVVITVIKAGKACECWWLSLKLSYVIYIHHHQKEHHQNHSDIFITTITRHDVACNSSKYQGDDIGVICQECTASATIIIIIIIIIITTTIIIIIIIVIIIAILSSLSSKGGVAYVRPAGSSHLLPIPNYYHHHHHHHHALSSLFFNKEEHCNGDPTTTTDTTEGGKNNLKSQMLRWLKTLWALQCLSLITSMLIAYKSKSCGNFRRRQSIKRKRNNSWCWHDYNYNCATPRWLQVKMFSSKSIL